MSDALLRQLERAWQAHPDDEQALDRFLAEARRAGVNVVERLAASDAPWAQLLRESLPVVRTSPGRAGAEGGTEELRGRRLFVLVRNVQLHHAQLDVFEDGALDCWGFLDRALFQARLDGTRDDQPPIACSVPEGESFSVHNLASATAGPATWSTTLADVARAIDLLLRVLAAPGRPLLDLEGEPTVKVGRVTQYKLGRGDASVVRLAAGRLVRGTTLPLFVRDGRTARLEPWIVWSDGLTQVGPRGPLRTLDDARRRLQAGELATRLRRGDRVELPGLGAFDLEGDPFCYVDPLERVREAQDELAQLEGGPGSIDRCRAAYEAFLEVVGRPLEPDHLEALEAARERLREAYEAVPGHLRHYVGDMDSKDRDVREALGLD